MWNCSLCQVQILLPVNHICLWINLDDHMNSSWWNVRFIENMMWISWKHSRKCRIIRIVSRTGFQIGTERAIIRDIRDWNIQREHYLRIYSDKGCKMSDSADFEDFIIKYTALVVFKALLCLFFSIFQCVISESEYI